MQLKLVSHFQDYYDSSFDQEGLEFRRVSRGGPKRSEAFSLLSGAGFQTPVYGKSCDLAGKFQNVVVYLDETAHRGTWKVVCDGSAEVLKASSTLACEFVPSNVPGLETYRPISQRLVVIGHRFFKLEYQSDDWWRSNCGNVQIRLLEQGQRDQLPVDLKLPLYSVGFVAGKAIDLNVAPTLQDTPVQELLPAGEVVKTIKDWLSAIGSA